METLASDHPPWQDLPAHVTENILERLPLSDYVCFAAVCRRWSSVQTSHRRRHSPSPPPMLPLPWLVEIPNNLEISVLRCYSPFEDKLFTLPSPSLDLDLSSHGWTLSFDDLGNPSLFHPISASTVGLPPLVTPPSSCFGFITASLYDPASGITIQLPPLGPPTYSSFTVSPPPSYAVSTIASDFSGFGILLLRSSDSSWAEVELPSGVNSQALTTLKQTVSIRGKHYHLCLESPGAEVFNLLVVDALSTPPTVQYFDMMPLSKMPGETGFMRGSTLFVELDGGLLLVREVVKVEDWRATVGFQVFGADVDRKMWVEVKSVGDDRVLVFHASRAVSLSAAGIGAARGNCIYFSKGMQHEEDILPDSGEAPWKVFDLATGRVTDLLLPNASRIEKSYQRLFVPSLC